MNLCWEGDLIMEEVGKRSENRCCLNKLRLGTRIYQMDGVVMLWIW